MNNLELLYTRRSIRKYKEEAIPRTDIEQILKAGMYAPSARNQQPWHFIIIDDKETLRDISKVHPYAAMLPGAASAIVVCGDLSLEKSEGYWPIDCSAATQNILLAAHAMDLGAVWLGVYPREKRMQALDDLFQLPDNVKPFSLISLGVPDEKKEHPSRFNPSRIHMNKW
jgi:nitroreductase